MISSDRLLVIPVLLVGGGVDQIAPLPPPPQLEDLDEFADMGRMRADAEAAAAAAQRQAVTLGATAQVVKYCTATVTPPARNLPFLVIYDSIFAQAVCSTMFDRLLQLAPHEQYGLS